MTVTLKQALANDEALVAHPHRPPGVLEHIEYLKANDPNFDADFYVRFILLQCEITALIRAYNKDADILNPLRVAEGYASLLGSIAGNILMDTRAMSVDEINAAIGPMINAFGQSLGKTLTFLISTNTPFLTTTKVVSEVSH